MVSRKKTANSKGRKAAKQGKKTQEANGPQKQRLKVNKNVQDEDDFLNEAIMIAATEKQALEEAAAAEERRQDSGDPQGRHQTGNTALREGTDDDRCWHGFKPSSHRQHVLCYEFVKTFGTVHDEATARNEDGFVLGIKATEEKHPEAWKDMACIKSIISCCLCIGTKLICEGEYNGSRLYATLARYLEEVIAVENSIQNDIYWTKVFQLYGADEHTLVKYFRRRIPCNCLNERYNEVKHLTKLGICYNPDCPLPDRKSERCKLRHCTKCCQANYCSIECQRADWKSHKKTCVDWSSKNKTDADILEVLADTQCHEKITDIAAMSKALAQEWSEKAEKHCTHGW